MVDGGFATTAQLLTTMTRQQLDVQVRKGGLIRVWYGVYSTAPPDLRGRLTALDLFMGRRAVACLGTAAALYGFDVENTSAIHVLDPGVRMRSTVGLSVHQRHGAPLTSWGGRLLTAPAWTAVEVARQLRRPRALATLDAALHSGLCSPAELAQAVREQHGRRGIVAVREVLGHTDARAESAMESEARLVMIDHGVAPRELQYEIRAPQGELYRVDFAWPHAWLAAEYEGVEHHSGPAAMRRDKARVARIQEAGWTIIPIVADDVRRYPHQLAARIATHLSRAHLAG